MKAIPSCSDRKIQPNKNSCSQRAAQECALPRDDDISICNNFEDFSRLKVKNDQKKDFRSKLSSHNLASTKTTATIDTSDLRLGAEMNELLETRRMRYSGVRKIRGYRKLKNRFKESLNRAQCRTKSSRVQKPLKITDKLKDLANEPLGIIAKMLENKAENGQRGSQRSLVPLDSWSDEISLPSESDLEKGDGCSSFSEETVRVKDVSFPSYLEQSFKNDTSIIEKKENQNGLVRKKEKRILS